MDYANKFKYFWYRFRQNQIVAVTEITFAMKKLYACVPSVQNFRGQFQRNIPEMVSNKLRLTVQSEHMHLLN